MKEVFLSDVLDPSPEDASGINQVLLVSLVKSLEKDVWVGEIELFWWSLGDLFETGKDVLDTFTLFSILQVVNAWAEKEPDSVCKKEIHFAGTTKYVTDLLNLNAV